MTWFPWFGRLRRLPVYRPVPVEPWPALPPGTVERDPRARLWRRLRNGLQSAAVLGAMAAVLALAAWLVFGSRGVVVVGIAAVLGVLLRPRVPTAWVLRMAGARPLPEHAAPQLHHAVRGLARRAGLGAPPALHMVPSHLPNAFATGTGADAAVVVTTGLLRRLTPRQLVGVLAHEVSHVRSGDTRVMNLSQVLGRLTSGLGVAGVWLTLVGMPLALLGDPRPLLLGAALTALPVVSALLQMSLSRSREYEADRLGAELTGDPEGLASALEALELAGTTWWERLVAPRRGPAGPVLLRTHPPTAERTRRLRSLRLV